MKTLVIYDNEGVVIKQESGTYRIPVGLPYLEVDVPAGKYITSVDVSGETDIAVLEDLPKSTEQIMQDRITDLELTIAEMLKV